MATLGRTLVIAFAATTLGVVLAIPVARWISTIGPKWRTAALVAVVFPMLVGDVIRAIGWASMVGYSGLIKQALVGLGIVSPDADLQHNEVTIVIAMASAILPILVLILEATFEGINPDVERASQSLGVAPTPTFFKVVLPQAIPGLLAASSLIFVMSVNTFSVPLLIGGSQVPMMAPVVYETIAQGNNWELGSAMAVTLLVLSLSIVGLYTWLIKRQFERWRVIS
nr:ABC transporter permease [Ornithinimicrobium sp. F0845]